MNQTGRRTFKDYVFALELISLLLTVSVLFIATRVVTAEISDNFLQIRMNDARKIGMLLDSHLIKANEELAVFVSADETERSSQITQRLMVTFEDLYQLDSELKVTRIYKHSKNSRIFEGFSFAGGDLEKLLANRSEGKSISRLIRGVENDRPSLYAAQKQNGSWYLGRVDMNHINQLVSQAAVFSDTPVLFLANDGFVLGTTNPELGIYSIELWPDRNENNRVEIEAGNRRWMAMITQSDIFGKSICILVPLGLLENLKTNLILLLVIFVGILLVVSILRHSTLRANILQPISNLTGQFRQVAMGEYVVISGSEALTFAELADLQAHFNQMTEAVRDRENSLISGKAELKQEKERLGVTLRSIGEAVISTDMNGIIMSINPVAEKLTAVEASEACYRSIDEIVKLTELTGQKVEETFRSLISLSEKHATLLELFLLSSNGVRHRIACSAAQMLSDTGDKLGLVMVFRDTTREHELQQQLLHTQKMDAIGQLAGGVAHDFNNMLGGILGAAELLKFEKNLNPVQEKTVNLIIQASMRAVDLASKLLTFGRKSKIASTPVNICRIVDDTIELMKRTVDKRITIERFFSGHECMVVGDDSQLQNALLNLGINACHAMPEGGTLSFRISETFFDAEICRLSPFDLEPGNYYAIEVRDTGCGIPPENLARIFEPFFTTREKGKGTGLGLAAVYGTVRDHHGSISVYSELNKGTVFNIYLPGSEAKHGGEQQNREAIPGRGLILVADDEEILRITAGMMLESLGYNVILAENGEKAVEQFINPEHRIDLVILDMIMPVMNGSEAFRIMRQRRPDCPIIISSGFHRDEDLAELKKQGLNGYIRKPFRKFELSQAVAEAMRNISGQSLPRA